jgi:hypothetical protein
MVTEMVMMTVTTMTMETKATAGWQLGESTALEVAAAQQWHRQWQRGSDSAAVEVAA